jgi:hypothetical protein
MFENSNKNKKAVITSAIVAKAAVRLEDGRINFIVVFQQSTRHEFYWVFQAKNARSARKAWKYLNHYGRDFNLAEKPYRDLGSFAAHYARLKHGEVQTVRVLHSRRMATLLAKTEHESIHADWTPQDVTKGSVVLVNARLASSINKKKSFYFNTRNRQLDEFSQSPNEVFVQDDFCEECGKRHSFAHFADGKRVCRLSFSEMKKHPGFDYRGFNPSTGFRFTDRSVVGAGA